MKRIEIKTNDFKANETFKYLRQALNLTQEELAKQLNISKSSVEKYEYGTSNFTFETLVKFAKKYNLEIIIRTEK